MDHLSVANLLVTLLVAAVGGGGAAKAIDVFATRGSRRADITTTLSKSMLKWAQETADDAAAARGEAATARQTAVVAHEQVDIVRAELREARAEMAQLRTEMMQLGRLLRSIRRLAYAPDGTIESIRELLERTPYAPQDLEAER